MVPRVEDPKVSPHKMENHKIPHCENGTNPLKIFFDFMYYSCISPTRFLRYPTSKLFYANQWLPQKVICAILNILNCFQYTSLIRLVLPKNLSEFEGNPIMYFNLFHRIANIMLKYVFMKSFWFEWKAYLDILNYLSQSNNQCFRPRKLITTKLFWYSFQGVIMATVFYSLVIGDRSPVASVKMSQWSYKTWLETLVKCARYMFNFENHYQDMPDLQQLSKWDWIISITLLISDIRGRLLTVFSDISILAAAITLKAVSSEFALLVRNTTLMDEKYDDRLISKSINVKPYNCDEQESWIMIYENFQAIQTLSDKINLVYGKLVLIYLADGLLYYSGKLGFVIFLDWEKYHRIDLFILSILFIAVLKTSADIGSQIAAIKIWLNKSVHRKSAPLDEVNLVLHDLTTNDIGMKGSDMFTITYGFLGGFSSLILTLFIISAQHKEQ